MNSLFMRLRSSEYDLEPSVEEEINEAIEAGELCVCLDHSCEGDCPDALEALHES